MLRNKSIIPRIESMINDMTPIEKEISDFFIENESEDINLSATAIAKKIYVSEASLTRFAKKIGYKGYREFIYAYQNSDSGHLNLFSNNLTKRVMDAYEELLNKSYSIVNEQQLYRVVKLMHNSSRMYIYGKGSSGLVAQEMKMRFMRLGLVCEAITEDDMIRMNNVVIDESCLVVGISVSGDSDVIINSIRNANKSNVKTVLITANNQQSFSEICDEVVLVALMETLSTGNKVSPQFPLLVIIDIIYRYFLNSNRIEKENIFTNSLNFLDGE